MPPGRYYIEDPCYAIEWEDWPQFMASRDGSPRRTLRGHNAAAFQTATGDGTFSDSEKHLYSVDSGTIGLVPEAIATQDNAHASGRFLEFNSPVACSRKVVKGRTIISFNHLKIDVS